MQLASLLRRFVVRAATVFALAVRLAGGEVLAQAWRASSSMSITTGYRIAQRLMNAQGAMRTALSSRGPPPTCGSHQPLAQTLEHLRAVLGHQASFESYQLALERSLLG